MFGEMRNALSITKEIDILDHIYSLPTPEDRERAMVRCQRLLLMAPIAYLTPHRNQSATSSVPQCPNSRPNQASSS